MEGARAENESSLYAGELQIRLADGLVLAAGRAMTLSVREFELLAAMAARQGTIVSRRELYAAVWGGELRPADRSVDVYVSKLRYKLEQAMPDRRFIHTHPGFGYRFQPQPRGTNAGTGALIELSRDVYNGQAPVDETARTVSRRRRSTPARRPKNKS